MSNWCEGCELHSYPYEAPVPISGEANRVFTCDKDVWNVIELLIAETKEVNEKMGKDFDIASSISFQLPFFCCQNIMLDTQSQKDISQYLYCKEFNTPPFIGDYGNQPQRWINKCNIIKIAMSKREEKLQKKAQREADMKVGKHNG